MLLSLLLLSLHLDHLVLQLLVLEHQELILGVELRNTVQSAIILNTQRLGSLINALILLHGWPLRARFRPSSASPIASLTLSRYFVIIMIGLP